MAYKVSVWIVLFLLFFNGGHIALDVSGTYDYMGVSPNPGDTSDLNDGKGSVQNFDTGKGLGDTLFGLYNLLASPLETLLNTIFPGAKMLKNIGVPFWIVNFGMAGLAVIPGIDLINFLRSG